MLSVLATKSPLGTEYRTENPFCCGLRTSGEREVCKKRRGRSRTSRTPENIEAVRRFVLQSPTRSARKHASALGISNRSVRRILHQDHHFHPYKMVVVQELTQQDWINRVESCQHWINRVESCQHWINRVESCQHWIERLPDDAVVFIVMKRISIFQAVLISKTCATGAV